MAVIKVEGKEVTLDDDVVKAGKDAVRAVLAANGFVMTENAEIQLPDEKNPTAPAIVTSRSTGNGQEERRPLRPAYAAVLRQLRESPPHVNAAIRLAADCRRADAEGDDDFIERAHRTGELERAVSEGLREGRDIQRTMTMLGHTVPQSSEEAPVGF